MTAASAGIGYEIAKSFVSEGAMIGLNGRRVESTLQASENLNHIFGQGCSIPLAGDIADLELTGSHIDTFGSDKPIDIYVANAGVTVFKPFMEVTEEDYDQLMGINLKGTYFSIQKVAKNMIEHHVKGRIIIMSSVCGIQSHKNLSAYAMTKSALRQLAKSLAEELGPHGITVNVVAPGATINERTEEDPEYKTGWESVTPNRRVGTTEDVAHATLFLADDLSRHINGEVLMVDGGWTTTSPLPQHL